MVVITIAGCVTRGTKMRRVRRTRTRVGWLAKRRQARKRVRSDETSPSDDETWMREDGIRALSGKVIGATPTTLEQKDTPAVKIRLYMKGTTVMTALDTYSEYMMISPQLVARWNLPTSKSDGRADVLGAEAIFERKARVTFEIGGKSYEQVAQVAAIQRLGVDLLLGSTELTMAGVHLAMPNGTARVRGHTYKFVGRQRRVAAMTAHGNTSESSVRACTTTVIPGGFVSKVRVHIEAKDGEEVTLVPKNDEYDTAKESTGIQYGALATLVIVQNKQAVCLIYAKRDSKVQAGEVVALVLRKSQNNVQERPKCAPMVTPWRQHKLAPEMASLIEETLSHMNEGHRKDKLRGHVTDYVLKMANSKSSYVKDIDVTLPIKEGACVRQGSTHPTPDEQKFLKVETDRMVQEGKLDRAVGQHTLRAFTVPKKEKGQLRLVIDGRRLNEIMSPMKWDLPTIRDVTDRMNNMKVKSVLDVRGAFYQLKLSDTSRYKVGFSFRGVGAFTFRVLPMGIHLSSAVLQLALDHHTAGLKNVLVYADDIIVGGSNQQEHDECLQQVLERLAERNIRLNMQKCQWAHKTVSFLGMRFFEDNTYGPDPKQVEVIRQWPIPKDVQQLRSFIGMANWLARFHHGQLKGMEVLLQRIRVASGEKGSEGKHRPVQNDEEFIIAFRLVKKQLSHMGRLYLVDWQAHKILTTDSSGLGGGAVLRQKVGDSYVPIAFYRRTYSAPQRRYASSKREALIVILAVEAFDGYLKHRPFTLQTDCKGVKFLLDNNESSTLASRWFARLAQYTIDKVQYKEGTSKEIFVPDLISRLDAFDTDEADFEPIDAWRDPYGDVLIEDHEHLNGNAEQANKTNNAQKRVLGAMLATSLARSTKQHTLKSPRPAEIDPDETPQGGKDNHLDARPRSFQYDEAPWYGLVRVSAGEIMVAQRACGWPIEALRESAGGDVHGTLTEKQIKWLEKWSQRLVVDEQSGIVVLREDRARIVVPKALRRRVMQHLHEGRGHGGANSTCRAARMRTWWPNSNRDVRQYVEQCVICQRARDRRRPARAMMRIRPIRMNQIVAVDVVALDTSPKAKKVLTIVDLFTRYVRFELIENETAECIMRTIHERWIAEEGTPEAILSDNGPAFTSNAYRRFLKRHGIRRLTTAPYAPFANGGAEAHNKKLLNTMTRLIQHYKERDWKTLLKQVQIVINNTPLQSTLVSPVMAQKGRKPNDGWMLNCSDKEANEPIGYDIRKLRNDAWRILYRAGAREAKRAHSGDMLSLMKGDLVMCRINLGNRRKRQNTHKIRTRWTGPHVVKEVVSPGSVMVELTRGPNEVPSTRRYSIHHVSLYKGSAQEVPYEQAMDTWLLAKDLPENTKHTYEENADVQNALLPLRIEDYVHGEEEEGVVMPVSDEEDMRDDANPADIEAQTRHMAKRQCQRRVILSTVEVAPHCTEVDLSTHRHENTVTEMEVDEAAVTSDITGTTRASYQEGVSVAPYEVAERTQDQESRGTSSPRVTQLVQRKRASDHASLGTSLPPEKDKTKVTEHTVQRGTSDHRSRGTPLLPYIYTQNGTEHTVQRRTRDHASRGTPLPGKQYRDRKRRTIRWNIPGEIPQ